MRLLLDTHALLWFYLGDPRLGASARAAIEEGANTSLVSPASSWELAIKIGLGKYALAIPHEVFVQEAIFDNGFEVLPILPKHTAALIGLPRHHGDPFDRLMIAQATVEETPILSADGAFDAYGVSRIW